MECPVCGKKMEKQPESMGGEVKERYKCKLCNLDVIKWRECGVQLEGRYGPGPFCPSCGSVEIHKISDILMRCKKCNLEFTYKSE